MVYLPVPVPAGSYENFEVVYAKVGRLRSEWETMSFPESPNTSPRNWILRSPRTIRSFDSGFSMRRVPLIWKSTWRCKRRVTGRALLGQRFGLKTFWEL